MILCALAFLVLLFYKVIQGTATHVWVYKYFKAELSCTFVFHYSIQIIYAKISNPLFFILLYVNMSAITIIMP